MVRLTPAGGTPIPPDGAVLVGARDTRRSGSPAEAPSARRVTRPARSSGPSWTGVVDAIGGGPVLVRDGRPVFRALEAFTTQRSSRCATRARAVGQRADGRIVLVVVDGRQPGYSVGMTNFELAQTLVRLGAVTACGARRRRLDDDGLRRRAAQPAVRPGRRARGRGGAVRLLLRRPRAAAVEPVALAERRRRRRDAALAYKLVRPVDGDGRA